MAKKNEVPTATLRDKAEDFYMSLNTLTFLLEEELLDENLDLSPDVTLEEINSSLEDFHGDDSGAFTKKMFKDFITECKNVLTNVK